LQVNGGQLTSSINHGPILCEQGSTLQCYRPALSNILHITPINAGVSINTVSPSAGSASGGTGFTLTGTGFSGVTSITFGGDAATSVHVVDSTTVTGVTPAHATGLVDVVITTPAGSATKTEAYTYETTTVGQATFGGIIACLNDGLNNLIAATSDNSTGIEWGGVGAATGATSTSNGAANTSTIVTALGDNGGTPYAAQLCNDYEIDSQGNTPCEVGNTCYNDWFLPSGQAATSQLNCLYENREVVGGFANAEYWSSTESSGPAAPVLSWGQVFDSNGIRISASKDFQIHVRCVRSFTP